MPQRQEITWAQLRVGVMVAVSLVVLIIGIFYISGQIGFWTRKYTLKAYFSDAGGLRPGAQVRLAGITVGNVYNIRISSYTDPNRAVEVVMRIPRRYQNEIRADSEADSTTAGLLGESYIDISRGGPGQRVVADGGEIRTRQEKNIKQIVQNADDVVSNLRVLSSRLNDITVEITSGKGSIGKLLYDETFYNRLNETSASAQRLVAAVEKGQGTIGKFLVDPTVYDRTVATLDRINQLADQIQSGKGSLAKFLSDPTLYDNANRTALQASKLVEEINKGNGTLGKIINDSELYNRVNDTVGHVDNITARMDRGEGSLGLLSTNTNLYSNLSASAQSLREFLSEFRQNPKKYLTVHVRIF